MTLPLETQLTRSQRVNDESATNAEITTNHLFITFKGHHRILPTTYYTEHHKRKSQSRVCTFADF